MGNHSIPSDMSTSAPSKDDEGRDTVQLKREVGLVRAIAVVAGGMIGSGIFISPKGILLGVNSVGMSLLMWVFCAMVSFTSALCFIELGCLLPRAGGFYQYILYAYGDLAAFLVSWSSIVIKHPAGNALVALTLGTYVADYVIPGNCAPPREAVQLFAILAIMLIVFINCLSVRGASGLMVVFTAAKIVALGVIITTGLVKLCQGATQYLDPSVSFAGSTTNILGFGSALYYGMWPYGGWDNINNLVEEMHNPAKNLPRTFYIALPTVTVIYLLTNVAYFTTLSPTEVLTSSAVAVTFAERNLGVMSWVVPLGVCISTTGSLLGSLLSDTRLGFAAGREGHMLKVISMVNVHRLTPLPAIALQGILAIVLIAIGDFNSIIMYNGIINWMIFGACFIALLTLRRKYPDKERPYKVHILVAIIAILSAVFMVLVPVISKPQLEYLYALILLALGLVVYAVFVRGKQQLPFMDHVTAFLQKLLLISPSREQKLM